MNYFNSAILLLLLWVPLSLSAQDDDTNRVIINSTDDIDSLNRTATIINTDTLENKPIRATMYSAILPGLGQVYNGKPWKVPIVYGGFVFFGYLLNLNHQSYKEVRAALFAARDGDPRTTIKPPLDRVSEERLERGNDTYRRNRDFVIILTAAWYLLNVVDAHVDAHLNEFTISDDLSLNIKPSVEQVYFTRNYGVTLTLNF